MVVINNGKSATISYNQILILVTLSNSWKTQAMLIYVKHSSMILRIEEEGFYMSSLIFIRMEAMDDKSKLTLSHRG